MDRPRVLVVEDRPSVLKLLATVLEEGYDVLTAPDCAAALTLIGTTPTDVVLTDIRMPDGSGFDVLRAVRCRAPETSVVMMTAYANVTDAVAAIKLGAFDYVAKPLDADEIALVVARAAEDRRRVADLRPIPGGGEEERRADAEGREPPIGFHHAVEQARDRASRDYLVQLMALFHGNVTRAAKHARMTRESLHRVLKKHQVRSDDFKEHAAPTEESDAAGPSGLKSAG